MSKKVILYIACSLDGFIARKNHDVAWLFTDQDYGFPEFEKSFDTAVIGRKTYEFAREHHDPPFKGKKSFIITSQREIYLLSTTELIFCSFDNAIDFIKTDDNIRNVFLVGGSGLIADFINAKFLHEIVVSFHPIILGEGIPLFEGIKQEVKLKFTGSKSYSSGLIKLRYEVLNNNQ